MVLFVLKINLIFVAFENSQYRPIAVLNNNGGNGHLRPTQYPSDSPNSPLDYEFSLNPNPSFRQQINSRRPIPPAQGTNISDEKNSSFIQFSSQIKKT